MTSEDVGIAAYHESIEHAQPSESFSDSAFVIAGAVLNAIRAAVEAEREACAQIAESGAVDGDAWTATERVIAAAIRARP